MTDGTAGWFRDPTDPALARWHDGTTWTEHTLVIADQTPGSEPAPPPVSASVPPPPAGAAAGPSAWDDTAAYGGASYGSTTADAGLSGKVRGMPTWAKVLGPVLVVAILGIAFVLTSGGSDDDKGKTETAATETIDAAVTAARRAGLPAAVADTKARGLIVRFCSAANDPTQVADLGNDLGALPVTTGGEVRQSVSALAAGARTSCADDMRAATDLIPDLQEAAATAFGTTTTAPTIPPEDTSSTVAGDSTGTSTTKVGGGKSGGSTGGGTVTTKPPAPTTTTTIPTVKAGGSCSSAGAKAKNKVAGGPLECAPKCFGTGTGALIWRTPGACSTPPSIDPNQTIPTTPTPPTTGDTVP